MDVLLSIVNKYNFTRLNSKLGRPIVFHCVPGAGKSSCIREILLADSRFRAYTLGIEDSPNLTNIRIQKYAGSKDDTEFDILDEYNLQSVDTTSFFAVFGDPIQSDLRSTLRADFICSHSRRFGKCTAQLLVSLGYNVTADGEDSVQISGLYDVDPVDRIIYHEEDVGCLLRRHNLEVFHISELVGQTFDSITFVTAYNHIPKEHSAVVFQCLTRHRRSLLIMCPNGTFSAT